MTYTSLDLARSAFHCRTPWVKRYFSAGVLLVCVLAQGFSLLACKRGSCDPAVALKTPALYLEHVGNEDKPIEPIVLVPGTRRPTTSEFQCATPTPFIAPERHMYTVTREEFSNAVKVIDDLKDAKPPEGRGEYRYVLVRGPGVVRIGRLDRDQSKSLFAVLQMYFKDRNPEVYKAISDANRMF